MWADEFSDSLNTDIWNIVEGDGCAEGLCGWGNNGCNGTPGTPSLLRTECCGYLPLPTIRFGYALGN